jgi:hypothetical protein
LNFPHCISLKSKPQITAMLNSDFVVGKIQAREVRRILNRKDRVHRCWWQYYDGEKERSTNSKVVGQKQTILITRTALGFQSLIKIIPPITYCTKVGHV